MRLKLSNFIHRAWSWCHIPPVLALSGANCYLPNPIGFGVHSLPPATTTSPSCYLSSPRFHLLTTYCCVGFSSRQHLPPLLFVTRLPPPSSLSIVSIYSLILQCESSTVIAHATIELCLNYPSMTLCTSHHIEAQLQFPLQFVLFNWIVVVTWVDVLFCNGNCLLFWFNILSPLPILWCTTNLLLLVFAHTISWWFVGFLASYGTNNLGIGVVVHTCEDGWHWWLSRSMTKFFFAKEEEGVHQSNAGKHS